MANHILDFMEERMQRKIKKNYYDYINVQKTIRNEVRIIKQRHLT